MRSIIFGIDQADRGAIDQLGVPIFPQPTLGDMGIGGLGVLRYTQDTAWA